MTTLIATLGSEPQVVTLAHDLLAARGRHAGRVVVVHTAPSSEPIRSALTRLTQAFADPAWPAYHGVRLTTVLLHDAFGRPLQDVDTPSGATAAFRAIYGQLRVVKQHALNPAGGNGADGCVDVCLAGGRKTMSAYAMVAAQLLFEDGDKLWHVVSAGEFLREKRLHPGPGDDAALIELPVLRFSDVSPLYSGVSDASDPFEAIRRGEVRARAQRLARARSFFYTRLSDAERTVVRLMVRDGLSDADMAASLALSTKTVAAHLAAAYRKAEQFYDLPRVTARALASLLAPVAAEMDSDGEPG